MCCPVAMVTELAVSISHTTASNRRYRSNFLTAKNVVNWTLPVEKRRVLLFPVSNTVCTVAAVGGSRCSECGTRSEAVTSECKHEGTGVTHGVRVLGPSQSQASSWADRVSDWLLTHRWEKFRLEWWATGASRSLGALKRDVCYKRF